MTNFEDEKLILRCSRLGRWLMHRIYAFSAWWFNIRRITWFNVGCWPFLLPKGSKLLDLGWCQCFDRLHCQHKRGKGCLQSSSVFKVPFVFSTVIFWFHVLRSPLACISFVVFVPSALPFLPDAFSRFSHAVYTFTVWNTENNIEWLPLSLSSSSPQSITISL